jgi:hypothetical protein
MRWRLTLAHFSSQGGGIDGSFCGADKALEELDELVRDRGWVRTGVKEKRLVVRAAELLGA